MARNRYVEYPILLTPGERRQLKVLAAECDTSAAALVRAALVSAKLLKPRALDLRTVATSQAEDVR